MAEFNQTTFIAFTVLLFLVPLIGTVIYYAAIFYLANKAINKIGANKE